MKGERNVRGVLHPLFRLLNSSFFADLSYGFRLHLLFPNRLPLNMLRSASYPAEGPQQASRYC